MWRNSIFLTIGLVIGCGFGLLIAPKQYEKTYEPLAYQGELILKKDQTEPLLRPKSISIDKPIANLTTKTSPLDQAAVGKSDFFSFFNLLRNDYRLTQSSATAPQQKVNEQTVYDLPYSSSPSEFTLCKLGPGNGPTLLVVGGIQGDEPGGFSAASLLATHYTITSGSVWVVPDLNFDSILKRNRGSSGDMNRKFSAIAKTDPQYELVHRIKSILLDDHVDLVLNLHDGSGFYRPTWEGPKNNPKRWGQSVIIDQKTVNSPRFGHLEAMAQKAKNDVNTALVAPEHLYHIHNTNTSMGDKEMEKSLSYFVVRNNKAAFGIEASKEFTTEYRSYYHMQVIESFMRQMGISFKRSFPLRPEEVLLALNSNLQLSMFNGKIVLPLDNVRPFLKKIPFHKKDKPLVKASRPLLAITQEKNNWRIAYGNRTLTTIQPEFMEFDDSLSKITIVIDNSVQTVPLGTVVHIKKSFKVEHLDGYRVNAIGAVKEKNGTEADVLFVQKDFMPKYSVDKSNSLYRVEIYKDQKFCGMVLVSFADSQRDKKQTLTAINAPESAFGY